MLSLAVGLLAVVVGGEKLSRRNVQDGLSRNERRVYILVEKREVLSEVAIFCCTEIVQGDVQLFVTIAAIERLVLG